MFVRKFLARTLPEAMAQVKAELGAEAVILHTSPVRVGGLFGLFGSRMVEVTAAAERAEAGPQPKAQPAAAPLPRVQVPTPIVTGAQAPAPVRAVPMAPAEPALSAGPALSVVKSEMDEMKAMLGQMMDRLTAPGPAAQPDSELGELCEQLTEAGLERAAALDLSARVRQRMPEAAAGTEAEASAAARNLLREDLGHVETVALGTGGRRVIALVGPTGVGKTTTLAKLAAHFSLGHRLNVALITADTYRVAAVEQLRTYAEILGTPLEIVYEPAEVHAALDKHAQRDLILVDTAGRSPRNAEHMRELQELIGELAPDETYLVVSLTASARDAANIVESYLPIGFDRYIFTKWDEVAAPSLIYNLMRRHRRPLSYITNGQNVPDDIEVASPEKITRAILGD